MKVFYHENISEPILSSIESNHAVKVLRLNINDTIYLIDGKGGLYKASITEAHHKKCGFKIEEKLPVKNKRNYHKHIAIAPTKSNDRMEWFIEKCTEIGIDEISLIITERSERKKIKIDRFEKVITATMKQCIQPFRPKINDPIKLNQLFQLPLPNQKFIAHLETGEEDSLRDAYQEGSDCIVLIGPEGDFTPNEIALTEKNDFISVSLGNSRLRTETAGIVACHTISVVNND